MLFLTAREKFKVSIRLSATNLRITWNNLQNHNKIFSLSIRYTWVLIEKVLTLLLLRFLFVYICSVWSFRKIPHLDKAFVAFRIYRKDVRALPLSLRWLCCETPHIIFYPLKIHNWKMFHAAICQKSLSYAVVNAFWYK